MPFDPDAYLADQPQPADPAPVDFDPDKYLKATDPNWIAQRANELKRGGYQAAQVLDVAGLQASGMLEERAMQRLADPAAAVHPLDRLVAKLIPGMANALQATPEAVAAAAQQRIDDAQRMRADSATALAANTAQAAAIPRSSAMREFDQAEGVAGTLSAIARNPVAAPTDLMANSLPAAAGGMALGALAGSETGPVGTMAGTFLGSLAPEYAGKMQEVAQSMGVDLRDPKQIEAFFADPEKVGQASALALRKGVPIAVLDALTAGFAGRWLKAAMGQGVKKVGIATVKEAAAQAAGAATGEAAGELAAGEDLSPKDIIAEVVADVPGAVQETATNLSRERRLARWAQALQSQNSPATGTQQPPHGAESGGNTKPVAGVPLPGAMEMKETPAGLAAGDPAAIDEIQREIAAATEEADRQRAATAEQARRQALQQRDLQSLVGEALAPRVQDLEGKNDLERHDFWRSMQSLASTLAQLQTMTPDGKQARSRQLELAELRDQANRIFAGAPAELVDAIALKLHGSSPRESVAALRDFHAYAGAQRQQYAPAAVQRDAEEQAKLRASLEAEQQRTAQARAEAQRAALERARIRDTGRDLEGKVADWRALPDEELGPLAAATEADGVDPDEIAGAQAELERRGREEGGQQPLTREEQIRLIERYGGINPAHPVHAAELATLRESELGRNRKLWREDGNTLDTLAQQIRQDVQNGPQDEADVLAWIAELAAGRTPRLYERGEMARAEYARSLPPATRFSVQRPQQHPLAPDRTIPGFNQVDFFEGDRNTRSATPDELRAEDYEVPDIPEAMPTGQYSEDQVRGRARWAAAARRADPITAGITEEHLRSEVRPIEAPPGQWTADNRANALRLREALAPYRGQTFGGVEITRDGIKHLARLQANPSEFRVAALLPELLRTSVPIGKPEQTDVRGPVIQRRVAAAIVDGKTVPVRITTKQFAGRTTLHHLETTERHSGISRRRPAEQAEDRIESGVPTVTVADLLPDVKSQPDRTYTARFARNQNPAPAAEIEPAVRKRIAKLERRFRAMFPALFADIDVRIDNVQRTLQAEDENPPEGVQAVYLPRLHAERDLIVLSLDAALRNDGATGLARLLHESAHAYWRMLSDETRGTLRTLYDRDLAEQWSPLWRDGEIATEVSQQDILSGDELGLEEWFSELMAALNDEWAGRRYRYADTPGWVLDLAARLREILAGLWRRVADFKGLRDTARESFLIDDFRAFLTRGHSAARTAAAGAAFARNAERQATPRLAENQPAPEKPADPRKRLDRAEDQVREIGRQLAALEQSQSPDAEEQGRKLTRQLAAAKRERAAAAKVLQAQKVEVDPVSIALAKIPGVRQMRERIIQLTAEIEQAQAEKRPAEALLEQRTAIHQELARIRRAAEDGVFPPPQMEMPLAFGDPNPSRNSDAKPLAAGEELSQHLRPIIIDDFSAYTGPQLGERLARLKELQSAIPGDDLGAGAKLGFLANLVRATREEMDVRRAALERQAEIDATEAKPAPETQAAREDEEFAREQERDAQETLAREAAAAIPDAPEETYPVREGVEQVGSEVSAATLAPRSAVAGWVEKVGELIRGFRSAVPELPTFRQAEKFATFREGLRLLQGLDEPVRREAEEAVADIVAPLQKLSTREARDKQARLQELHRQIAATKDEAGQQGRRAEIKRIEGELASDPWWIFQNVVLYGDLFTRSRLYRRDDGSPISLPGNLNPAEAEHLFKLWLTRAHQHPQKAAILEARDRHKAFVGRIADELKRRGFVFSEGSNTNYFPHVMLERWDGNLARVKIGTAQDFRAYLITPVGSTKPIETDYLKAMYYHAVQVLAHNRRADILRDYIAREDIKPQLIEEAKQARRRDPDAPPVTWQQIFHKQYADEYAIYAPDPDEIPLHPELVLDRDALAKRLGIVLGSGPLHEELRKAGLSNLPLQPGEIQEMLVAGSKELWVLPKPVAEALRGVSRRAKKTDNLLVKVLAGTQGLWKRNILFAPWNWVRFDFNNAVSDFEKVLVADPAMARGLIDAGRDVYRFVTGDESASDDVRLAFRLGVLDTLTAAEVNALRAQRPFEAFETTGEALKRATVNRLTSYFTSSRWNTMEWSKLREATLRFAKFRADLERIRNGSRPQYGGAYWRNVEALQRVGAPEGIREIDRLGRGMGRQGPGTGAVMSAQPYVLQWTEHGRRREEAFASKDGRAKRRVELESAQRKADEELGARKAAAISRATFGDYGELTPNGNSLRSLAIPFWAWTEVNFRYHANLFRNMRDMLTRGELTGGQAAGQIAKQAASLGARAGMGMVLRLALPYLAVTLWNASMFGDDEDDLSEEDRRRFHLLLGRDDNGKIRVVYLPTAFSDVLKWFSGNRAAALVGDVTAGRTDWQTAAGEFAGNIVPDFLNNTIGSAGPVWKIPYTLVSGKSTFPDVTDQRTIPSYDMRRVIIGQMTDQFTAEMLELAINRDYVASRDAGEWAQQAILQVRRRDPESWAFYAIKDKASRYEEKMTGRREARAAYDAPEAQVLRQFRRAIYQADVPTAVTMYQRLLEFGYTAERFESSVRSQDPLYGLSKAMRGDFLATLNDYEREQLRGAYRYYLRMQEMEGTGRRLFPRADASERTRARYQAAPRIDLLHAEIQKALATQNDEALVRAKVGRELRESARN